MDSSPSAAESGRGDDAERKQPARLRRGEWIG